MDKIFFENLRLIGKHGAMSHERRLEQEFLVDLIAEVDTSKAGESDKLKDALNYAWMRDVAREVIEGDTTYLIEKLAAHIAEKILQDKRVASITVSIRKPSVLASGVPGITITRTQTS